MIVIGGPGIGRPSMTVILNDEVDLSWWVDRVRMPRDVWAVGNVAKTGPFICDGFAPVDQVGVLYRTLSELVGTEASCLLRPRGTGTGLPELNFLGHVVRYREGVVLEGRFPWSLRIDVDHAELMKNIQF